MTKADILYWCPQLVKNQEWVGGSENMPTNYVHGAQFNEVGWFEFGTGVPKAWYDRQTEVNTFFTIYRGREIYSYTSG